MSLPPQEITVKGKAARIRGATWTHDQVKKLFDVWTQPDIYQGLLNEKKKLDIFKNMASILTDLGVNRTWRECRAKIKNLKADFRKSMEKKTAFRYFEQMKKIMNLDGAATKSSGVGGSMTIDSYFAPSSASSSQTQFQHDEQEHHRRHESGGSEAVVESQDDPNRNVSRFFPGTSTSTFEQAIPSTSRSVIQHVSMPQYQKEASYQSQADYHLEPDESYQRFTPPPSTSTKHSPYSTTTPERLSYTPQYYQEDDRRQSWRQSEENEGYRYQQESQSRQRELLSDETVPVVEHDSSSRSSMIITHVVSNVIEPVTQVVMPSSGSAASRAVSEDLEIIDEQPVIPDDKQHDTPPPLRLEFVLDEENVILQSPHSPSPIPDDVPDSGAPPTTDHFEPVILSTSSPSMSPKGTSAIAQSPKTPPQILRQRLIQQQKRSPPKSTSSPPKSTPRRKSTLPTISSTAKPGPAESKRRKMLEILNRKTVETISDLLTETSQNLLKELQDAEQRFISWEEEKRVEERKREEVMFTKLIAAMKSSIPPPPPLVQEDSEQVVIDHNDSGGIISNFSSMSKRVNDMVCGEVKQTEESLRQWEMKMQRQESRHTEKLFGMIINAIKTSSSSTREGNDD